VQSVPIHLPFSNLPRVPSKSLRKTALNCTRLSQQRSTRPFSEKPPDALEPWRLLFSAGVRVHRHSVFIALIDTPFHTFRVHTRFAFLTEYDSVRFTLSLPIVAVYDDVTALSLHIQIQVSWPWARVAKQSVNGFDIGSLCVRSLSERFALRTQCSNVFTIRIRPSSRETTPLLPGKTQRTIFQDGPKLITCGLLACFVIVNLFMHYVNCPLYPSTMNTIRHQWEKEEMQHNLLREGWGLEKLEHDAMEEMWKLQKEWHDKDVARRIQEENERRERVRHEYEEMERRENQRRENQRNKWRREVEDHDRIKEERRKREEEERQKLNMFWSGIEAHTCTTYATREYTAQLMNLPTTWEHRVEACKATPLEVHGISYFPKSCEDKVGDVD